MPKPKCNSITLWQWSQTSLLRTPVCASGARFRANSKMRAGQPFPQFPQFLKVKEQPTKEEHWRGLIEVAQLRSESMGEGFTERIWTQLGDHEKAFAWLEKSAARGDDLLPNFMRSPIMDPHHIPTAFCEGSHSPQGSA